MLKIAFLSTCVLFAGSGSAQEATPLSVLNGPGKHTLVYLRDLSGKPLPRSPSMDIEGSPFLNDEFASGRVVFNDGKMSNDVYLQFDLFNNRLLFKRDGMALEFVDSVRTFYLQHTENNTLGVVFRSNFPPIAGNTRATFYELLVDGKIALLKHRYKTIIGFREFNLASKRTYTEDSQLYAALPDNTIIRIKKDRNFLMKAMPEYADKIMKLTNDLRLKNEESLVTLFQELNK
ncbi:hypothetical protein ACX0G7_20085 [Flavitalea antarctica]